MNKNKKLKEKFEEECLTLFYKHDNEITLAIDDLWKFIDKALQDERERATEEALQPFRMLFGSRLNIISGQIETLLKIINKHVR